MNPLCFLLSCHFSPLLLLSMRIRTMFFYCVYTTGQLHIIAIYWLGMPARVFSAVSVLSWGQKYSQTGFWTGSLCKQREKNILKSSVHERLLPQWIFLLRLTFCCLKTVCLTTVYFHTHVQKHSNKMSVLFLSPISAPLVLIDRWSGVVVRISDWRKPP